MENRWILFAVAVALVMGGALLGQSEAFLRGVQVVLVATGLGAFIYLAKHRDILSVPVASATPHTASSRLSWTSIAGAAWGLLPVVIRLGQAWWPAVFDPSASPGESASAIQEAWTVFIDAFGGLENALALIFPYLRQRREADP